MFLPPPPPARYPKAGLTILEALVLLIAAAVLAIVTVPVFLVNRGYIKHEEPPLVTAPPVEKTKPTPIPPRILPETPSLPPPANSPVNR